MSKAENYYDQDFAPPPARRTERGCFYYGCLFSLILAAIVAVLIALALVFVYRAASRAITQYTDTAPMAIAAPSLSEEEAAEVLERARAFKEATNEGREATLTLTGPELNALLNANPDVKGRAAVDIVGDELRGEVSVPFRFPGFGQRYLNAKCALNASIDGGDVVVKVVDAEVRGRPVPEEAMKQLREGNLAEDVRKDPDLEKTIRRIESLTIKDGKITIRSRVKSARSEEAEGRPAGEEEEGGRPRPGPEPGADDAASKRADPPGGLIGDFPPEVPKAEGSPTEPNQP